MKFRPFWAVAKSMKVRISQPWCEVSLSFSGISRLDGAPLFKLFFFGRIVWTSGISAKKRKYDSLKYRKPKRKGDICQRKCYPHFPLNLLVSSHADVKHSTLAHQLLWLNLAFPLDLIGRSTICHRSFRWWELNVAFVLKTKPDDIFSNLSIKTG